MLMELHIQGLNFSYGEKKVFEDTNIDLSADKITVLFGKNGTGKSTLLKLIAGIESCDSGNISFSDCLLYTSPSPRDRTRSRMPSSA